jgi:hypothetical protein
LEENAGDEQSSDARADEDRVVSHPRRGTRGGSGLPTGLADHDAHSTAKATETTRMSA